MIFKEIHVILTIEHGVLELPPMKSPMGYYLKRHRGEILEALGILSEDLLQ